MDVDTENETDNDYEPIEEECASSDSEDENYHDNPDSAHSRTMSGTMPD